MSIKRLPFGRINEYTATLTEEQRSRTAVQRGQKLDSDYTVKIFSSRKIMAGLVRKGQESNSNAKWSPVVKLQETEGYSN